MGLFSGKKTTYVASSAYNMAGDTDGRVNYLKTIVIQNIVSDTDASLADSVTSGMLHGPTFDMRGFYRWASKDANYGTIGMPTAQIMGLADIDNAVVTSQLPTLSGKTAVLQSVSEETFDYSMAVEKWLLDNYPGEWGNNWTASIDNSNNITIVFENGSIHSFHMSGYNQDALYLYILYAYYSSSSGSYVTGSDHVVSGPSGWPDVTGWTVVADSEVSRSGSLDKNVTVVKYYSDGRPDETTSTDTSSSYSFIDKDSTFTKKGTAYQSGSTSAIRTLQDTTRRVFTTSYSINTQVTTTTNTEVISGVTVTTTTTTTEEILTITRIYRDDVKTDVIQAYSDPKLWLYEVGSNLNSALEDMIDNPTAIDGNFYPPIPVRYDNAFISQTYRPAIWAQTPKAYKKAFKGKHIEDLIEQLKDNDSLSDIDFAYIHFGVALNVEDNSAKKYIYLFFKKLMQYQVYTDASFTAFLAALDAYNDAIDNYGASTDPITGVVTIPPLPTLPTAKLSQFHITCDGTQDINFDMRIYWNYINEGSGTGKGKSGAKKGDFWFQIKTSVEWDQYVANTGNSDSSLSDNWVKGDSYEMEWVRLFWQTEDNAYTYLDVYGMKHENFVYNGKSVLITTNEALNDDAESGFIVPLHYATIKSMSLKDANQMSTACSFIVFNCYEIVKTPWYASGFFKIFAIVAIAIVSAIFTGGAGFGLLGSNIAVGTSLGLSGTLAGIVGSIVNALAAVVLTSTISFFSTKIFGEAFGAIIGAVLSFVVVNSLMTFQMTGNFQFQWGDLMKADNLLKLTDAVSQGYSGYMNSVNQGLLADSAKLQQSYEEQSKAISDKYSEVIGYSDIAVNGFWWQDSSNVMLEPSQVFLSRTLMVGSDIAQTSIDMVTDYVDLSLNLPNVYT